ncbi:MAG: hypothetical protein J6D25_02375 [Eggerthellaceae bacterium]|nr:hypothetical protein [Eggerthellaceae bacterium]
MATAVVSGRVSESIRQRAEIVMRKAGLKPTDIIQSVWATMAETGEVPDIAQKRPAAQAEHDALEKLNRFLDTLPPANPKYSGWNDSDILALKALDDA